MLNSEWSEVELICLQNDLNNGLGFGLLGNKTTGVLVRNIVPGGSADINGNLRPGDLILRVGEVSTRGLGPDQVARLLRQTVVASYSLGGAADNTSSTSSTSTATTTTTNVSFSPPVTLIVARPAQGSPSELAAAFEKQSQQARARQPLGSRCIVPTDALDESMDCIADLMLQMPTFSPPTKKSLLKVPVETPSSPPTQFSPPSTDAKERPPDTSITSPVLRAEDTNKGFELEDDGVEFSVLLKKPPGSQNCGLGLTIVGYVSEKDKDKAVTGIYVKDVLPNGLASRTGKIKRHDQIIKVNGIDLKTLSNKAAANLLKTTGPVVHLTFLRHTSGRVCEQLRKLVSSSSNPRSRQAFATLPSGFRQKSQSHRRNRSRRNIISTDSQSHGTLCISGETRAPLGVSSAQSELVVGPQVNSGEDSEESSDLTRDLLGPSTCQSLPMLTAASLMEVESTTMSSTTSTQGCFGKRIRRNSQGEDDEQTSSSTAASMTLNSSPLDEMDESEMESPLEKDKNLVGSFELIQLRAAVHYVLRIPEGKMNSETARFCISTWVMTLVQVQHNFWLETTVLCASGRVSADLVKLMEAVWYPTVGSGKKIEVFRVVRPKNIRQLGFSLIGSITEPRTKRPIASTSSAAAASSEGEDEGEEPGISENAPARHFVHTVLPGGLFSSYDKILPGDELLQPGFDTTSLREREAPTDLSSVPLSPEERDSVKKFQSEN
ncbi:hypothetical protein Aperf_G00000121215 [Anoplocephala perfoliata]